jgi:glycosyltransferase involved in cell wall biosynthesis
MRSVSVIIPTYNYGQFVAEAIESVLAQTYPIAEIAVVDDGSTDETEVEVLRFGERVRYVKQTNAGVCAARNRGVADSTGEFIAFLDADDIWEPTKIEKQLAKFVEDPEIGLVHCGLREFDSETGETVKLHLEGCEGSVADELVLFEKPTVNVSGSVLMVPHRVFDEVGGFDTRLKNGEDWEFCFRVAHKYKVGFVPEPLVNYRNHGVNATKNVAEMERSTLIAWKKVFSTDDPNISNLRRRSYSNLHKVLAGSYLHNRQYAGFARNLLKSLWYRPSYMGYYFTLPFRRKKN